MNYYIVIKQDDEETTDWVFLLGLCTSVHLHWVSLFLPQYLLPLLIGHKLSLLWFSCQHGVQKPRRKLLEQSRTNLQLNSAASVENI